ncbi:hypothetical protein LCGC14_0916280 [marine sediment metagenome]|uniref:CDP-alcohol phosphatidyltransferase family protein n=1 Tax=marine sediment metagenome TaxID=412755 RepID=A0A0F9PCY5_9ZZZZ|nr:CDP-alcohol phosphatidyltransferase family protein [bacterium]
MNEKGSSEKRINQQKISIRYIDLPVRFLIKHNITPNKISVIGFILFLIASLLIGLGGLYFSIWFAWIVPAVMGVAGAFDLFDGEVARRTGKESQAGAFLDSNLDRLSDAIFILGLIYGGLINYLLGYLILFLVIMISYTRSRAENEGVNMKGIGFMERADRILFMIFTIIAELTFYFLTLLILGAPITLFFPIITSIPVSPIFLIAIIIFIFSLIYTLLQRIIFSFKALKNMK